MFVPILNDVTVIGQIRTQMYEKARVKLSLKLKLHAIFPPTLAIKTGINDE